MPSVQWQVYAAFSHDSVAVLGINKSASVAWLKSYSGQRGISYPFIYDTDGSLFNLYEVGASFGNIPPTFVIIDTKGIVRYRIDDTFNKAPEMAAKVRELLSSP